MKDSGLRAYGLGYGDYDVGLRICKWALGFRGYG